MQLQAPLRGSRKEHFCFSWGPLLKRPFSLGGDLGGRGPCLQQPCAPPISERPLKTSSFSGSEIVLQLRQGAAPARSFSAPRLSKARYAQRRRRNSPRRELRATAQRSRGDGCQRHSEAGHRLRSPRQAGWGWAGGGDGGLALSGQAAEKGPAPWREARGAARKKEPASQPALSVSRSLTDRPLRQAFNGCSALEAGQSHLACGTKKRVAGSLSHSPPPVSLVRRGRARILAGRPICEGDWSPCLRGRCGGCSKQASRAVEEQTHSGPFRPAPCGSPAAPLKRHPPPPPGRPRILSA